MCSKLYNCLVLVLSVETFAIEQTNNVENAPELVKLSVDAKPQATPLAHVAVVQSEKEL
jgi:hypothetical protein